MMASKRWMWCAVLTLCCVAGGCESDNKDHNRRDRNLERAARRDRGHARDRDLDRRPDPVIAHDRDRDRRDPIGDRAGDRIDDRAGDRTGDRRRGMQEIPTSATALEGGGAAGLEYEPSRDGVVYVYNVDEDRVIYVGRVRDRERFRLDPDSGRALINSRTVFRSDLNPRHRYRLYFDRAG